MFGSKNYVIKIMSYTNVTYHWFEMHLYTYKYNYTLFHGRFQWSRGLRRGSAGLSLAGIAGSNSARGMVVSFLLVLLLKG